MGVQAWGLRDSEPAPGIVVQSEMGDPAEKGVAAPVLVSEPVISSEPAVEAVEPSAQPSPAMVKTRLGDIDQLDWSQLKQAVADCRQCGLCENRSQTVFGVGNVSSNVLVVGEAPGAEEDKRGEPFVGSAGQLLNQMLWAAGYARDDVYIANVIKCRPPNNRDPSLEEMTLCQGYLKRQIALVKPQVILAVGRIAAQTLLQSSERIGRLRGRVHNDSAYNVPIVATYHPAYLLRSPHEKAKSWVDLKLVKSVIQS